MFSYFATELSTADFACRLALVSAYVACLVMKRLISYGIYVSVWSKCGSNVLFHQCVVI